MTLCRTISSYKPRAGRYVNEGVEVSCFSAPVATTIDAAAAAAAIESAAAASMAEKAAEAVAVALRRTIGDELKIDEVLKHDDHL